MTSLTAACRSDEAGWTCDVSVGDDANATHHQVSVGRAELERLQPGATEPTALVRAAFEFLLTREPRESILRQFELSVIGRYFPDWEADVTRSLGEAAGGLTDATLGL